MAIIKTLDILLRGRTDTLNKDLQKGKGLIDRFAKNVPSQLRPVFRALTFAGAGFGAFKVGKFGLQVAAEAQTAAIGFEVLTGSVGQATKTLAELKAFSDVTPFTGSEIRDAGKKLLAARVSVDELTDRLGFLGDASAAVGARLSEVTQVYSKIQNQNKLTGETFEQLAERSINLAPIIQKQLGLTADEFLKMRAAGKITADIVDDAFKSMTSEGGIFFGAMDKLSQSYSGRVSTLQTKMAALAKIVGDKLLPVMIDIVNNLIKAISPTTAISGAMEGFGNILVVVARGVNAVVFGVRVVSELFGSWAGKVFTTAAALGSMLLVSSKLVKVYKSLRTITASLLALEAGRASLNLATAAKAAKVVGVLLAVGAGVTQLEASLSKSGDKIAEEQAKILDGFDKVNVAASKPVTIKANTSTAGFGTQEAIKTVFGVTVSGPIKELIDVNKAQLNEQKKLTAVRGNELVPFVPKAQGKLP